MKARLVAHRGDCAHYPENSLPALASALKSGVNHLEFDVQLTADRVPVLLHDVDLTRTTGQPGNVTQMQWDAVKNLQTAEPERFGTRFRHVLLPSLADAVEFLNRSPGAIVFVEIKPESVAAFGVQPTVDAVLAALKPARFPWNIIGLDPAVVEYARKRGPRPVGWVLSTVDEGAQAIADTLRPDYLFCDHRQLPKTLWIGPWRWVAYATSDPATARALFARGIALVETDDPQDLGEALEPRPGT
ncbi:MAG: glycerophosphodiester phosphodiesterase family protein [Ectothiorhodospiraceae bacterium]|jgi:glycerophosphoryl diester phosphodiesterase|nr:glycerophosphodiester phosphodiesterase family protein [Ectothiorhodospiraceae bacterium]